MVSKRLSLSLISVEVVFNSFLLTDATDRSKIIGDQKRFFIALSLYPLSFFANTPFNLCVPFQDYGFQFNVQQWPHLVLVVYVLCEPEQAFERMKQWGGRGGEWAGRV